MSLLKNKNYSRTHLRAPLKTYVLYEDDSYVFKAKLMNISEGGILIQQLPHFPNNEVVPIMFSLPNYLEFPKLKREEILSLSFDSTEKKIFRAKIKTIRRTQSTTSVEQIFQIGIGGKFIELTPHTQKAITNFVQTFTKNLVYLLNLLEINADAGPHGDLIKHLSLLFGYEPSLTLSEIHQLVRHDYQSLEWL